ncbi:zinc ribbon domain-containing protein [uncultured Desulfuromusa sp.]|uniref:zinc ribbon domain-containing protein n=1 Tax=uncultured Desulfuromusa sp. TaxID=219183 RepID=UPI002AA683E8|nr:zinc ribbon domain-containing protein [uncultured Desulfuromusa sp.]
MICPKCGHENQPGGETCLLCGVIFAKIKSRPADLGLVPVGELAQSLDDNCIGNGSGIGHQDEQYLRSQSQDTLRHLFFPESSETNSLIVWGRGLILLGMIIWGSKLVFVSIASNNAGESLLHLVNLPFHEAGHVVFRPFGQFITTLGGTLGQLLVPLICGGTLLFKTRDPFDAAVCSWWFGENFLDIAPYINDASAGILPLVGDNTGSSAPYGFHDWEYLLTETGMLHHDQILARLAHGFGSFLMISAILWASYVLYLQFKGTGKA